MPKSCLPAGRHTTGKLRVLLQEFFDSKRNWRFLAGKENIFIRAGHKKQQK